MTDPALEGDTIRRTADQASLTAGIDLDRRDSPDSLRVEWDDHRRNTLVPLDQLSPEALLVRRPLPYV